MIQIANNPTGNIEISVGPSDDEDPSKVLVTINHGTDLAARLLSDPTLLNQIRQGIESAVGSENGGLGTLQPAFAPKPHMCEFIVRVSCWSASFLSLL